MMLIQCADNLNFPNHDLLPLSQRSKQKIIYTETNHAINCMYQNVRLGNHFVTYIDLALAGYHSYKRASAMQRPHFKQNHYLIPQHFR